MNLKNWFLILSFFIVSQVVYSAPSAKRLAWQNYFPSTRTQSHSGLPEKYAQKWNRLDINSVQSLPAEFNLDEIFIHARDSREIRYSPFDRRPSFLYPDDGCYARAEMMNNIIENKFQLRFQKIFVFGNLWVDSENASFGGVGWWYHVAPVIKVDSQVFVIDPSIDSIRPMLIKDWLLAMSQQSNINQFNVAICDQNSYSPTELCFNDNGKYGRDLGLSEQIKFFDKEWERLEELNRNPQAELGDFPPWKQVKFHKKF